MSEHQRTSPLDRSMPVPGWFSITTFLVVLIAAALRLIRLDVYLLNVREANWAFDAWSLYIGKPLPLGQTLPESGPFILIWNALTYFLFGVTDATARIGSAVLGIALVAIVLLLRPVLSRAQTLSIAGILAISPTMVFASRTIEPGIAAAFFAVLILVALVRLSSLAEIRYRWMWLLGIAVACLYATGPLGVTTIFALSLGILAAAVHDHSRNRDDGAMGNAVKRIGSDRRSVLWMMGGVLTGLLVIFSRLFSSPASLVGIWTTLSDWGTAFISGSSTVPAMFYFWALMLYETGAVAIAAITAILHRTRRSDAMSLESGPRITPLFFVVWFAVALLLHTVASTRDTGATVLVVLPVLLLAGVGLGETLERTAGKINLRSIGATIAALVLVAYSIHTAVGLAFVHGESASEPLAIDTPSIEFRGFLDQVTRLSRDLSVNQASNVDPTGRFGLNIKVTPEYEWPFAWYFRDYSEFSVATSNSFDAHTDVAIAANAEVMDKVGLTTSTVVWINKPGDPLTMMRTNDILRTGLNPSNWQDAWNYMINRERSHGKNPRLITVGYSVRIMNKIGAATGPFNLFDGSSPGSGAGLGQLDLPTGIAVDEDGTIYVLNAANARIDRFDANGTFLGIWNGQVDAPLQLSWNGMQGGTGLYVGPNDLVYVADTWNHDVVAVSTNGTVARVLGNRGVQTDILDGGDPLSDPGLFFGPRDIAVTLDFIYVTDTGNERVQVFAKDGAFVTAFGGYGDEDGEFIEPTGIAVDLNGNIWVADSGNARLQVFDADGTWLETYPIVEWQDQIGVQRINMLAFNDDGVLYFTTPAKGVWAWQDGRSVILPGTEFLDPGGIAFDHEGNLLITDKSNAQVVRLVPILPPGFAPMASPVATPKD